MRPCLKLEEFHQAEGVVLDVRSPSEFAHARLPGGVSFPLFSDEERAEVGTLYKQRGRQEAITRGMELLASRIDTICEKGLRLSGGGPVRVYCWRGGMRSQVIAGLLALNGMPSCTLFGGYKTYRRHCLHTLRCLCPQLDLRIIGGLTGTRKTEVLHALQKQKAQVLDLEALACHRGSVFGGIGMPTQPSNEQLENTLAEQLKHLKLDLPVWVEDENRAIGSCALPLDLYQQINKAPVYVLERDDEERLEHLLQLYGNGSVIELQAATKKLHKRLGYERMQHVLTLLESKQRREAFRLLLHYYDRAYTHALSRSKRLRTPINTRGLPVEMIADQLTAYAARLTDAC